MRRRFVARKSAAAIGVAGELLLGLATVPAAEAGTAPASHDLYTPGAVNLDSIKGGYWTLSQGDPTAGDTYPTDLLLPTYTPGGPTTSDGDPNMAVYPGTSTETSTSPFTPYVSGVAGTTGPLPGYCSSGGTFPETGSLSSQADQVEPFSPYYFPDVVRNADGSLTGYFDYRPKDAEEAIVAARSTDGGKSWTYEGMALAENPTSYCPGADTNDNGQGHPFVLDVKGQTYLYTVQRPAGDTLCVGLLVHALSGDRRDPLAGLPATQSIGVDPNTFVSSMAGAVTVPASGTSATIPVTTLGTTGSAEQIFAGQYEDLSASDPSASIITCTGLGTASLTGCTATDGLTVNPGDNLVQVFATTSGSSSVTIPEGPNDGSSGPGSGGLSTLGISINTNDATTMGSLFNANISGRVYIDGATVYCSGINSSSTKLENCTTTTPGGITVPAGSAITTDPIVPSSAEQTTGLVAPDGIVGSLPSSYNRVVGRELGTSIPRDATVVLYGEKILNYYDAGTVSSAFTFPSTTGESIDIPLSPSTTFSDLIPSSGSFTVYVGDAEPSADGTGTAIETLTCTGYTTASLTGCTGYAHPGWTVSSGHTVGGPGAAIAPSSVLSSIGEGSSNPKTLFKNNEDLTVLRYAWTTDGVDFTDIGAISGTDSQTSTTARYTDVNDPSSQAYPAGQDLAQGAKDDPELRYVGTRGSIIQNPNGSITMFDSGAWESDGDSDAFNQIFETTSWDGIHWSVPRVVESTDYTFSAREQQDAALAAGEDEPLNVSGYFSGRTYSPSVVQNPNGTLTMIFSGYSTPKPLPADGSVLGDGDNGTTPWTVSASDPALYRNILTVNLSPSWRSWGRR